MSCRTEDPPSVVAEIQELCLASPGRPGPAASHSLRCTLRQGDYHVVVGGGSSGKTRLLEILAGLARPEAGAVRLFGRDTSALRGDDWMEMRRRVGLVFDDGCRLFPQMTVIENVALPVCYHLNQSFEEVRSFVDPLLDWMGITHLRDQIPGRIGRGWRPRIGLARALTTKPELLLLDNPLAGLDPDQTSWWLGLLKSLVRGHAWYGGVPVTVLVTASDPAPWNGSECLFTYLHDVNQDPIEPPARQT